MHQVSYRLNISRQKWSCEYFRLCVHLLFDFLLIYLAGLKENKRIGFDDRLAFGSNRYHTSVVSYGIQQRVHGLLIHESNASYAVREHLPPWKWDAVRDIKAWIILPYESQNSSPARKPLWRQQNIVYRYFCHCIWFIEQKKRTRERGLDRKEKRRLVHTKLCKSGVSLPSAFVLPVLYTHIRLCSTHLEVGDCYKHAVCCPICLRGLTSLKQKKISSKFYHFYISSVPL